MASLRVAAFFAATTCTLLLAASASSSPLPPPPAVQRDVGDEAGYWTETVPLPPAGDVTGESLIEWAARQPLHVGDVLDFKRWNGTVLLVASRGDYERCGAGASTTAPASPPWPSVAGGGGGTKFELDRPGTFYFVSGVPGHCEAGQRMAVRVVVFHSGVASAPDDWAVPSAGTTAPPATVVFKVTTSTWLWVATVGVFGSVLLFVIFFCLNEQAKLANGFMDALAARDKGLPSGVANV